MPREDIFTLEHEIIDGNSMALLKKPGDQNSTYVSGTASDKDALG